MTITIFTARSIVTMDPERPAADTVAVENGRIIAVGNPLDAAPVRLDEIEVIGTMFRGDWFQVPDDVRERAAAAASRGPGALQLLAGRPDDLTGGGHDHAGCICDVARAVMRAIA